MKKQYTKKQITEAIAYWEKKLGKLDESTTLPDLKKYWTAMFDACHEHLDIVPDSAISQARKDNNDSHDYDDYSDDDIAYAVLETAANSRSEPFYTRKDFAEEFDGADSMPDSSKRLVFSGTDSSDDERWSLYDVCMSMFKRGCKYVGFSEKIDSRMPGYIQFGDRFEVACEYARQYPEESGKYMIADDWGDEYYVVGFGDSVATSDGISMPEFEVTTSWYRPTHKTDYIDAWSEEEARQIVEDKYAGQDSSESESDWTYNGIIDIEEQ